MIRIYAANDSNVLTDISAYVNLETPGVISVTENAEEGSVGSCTIQFEDPTGALELVGLRDIVIDDDLASFKRIWRGRFGARHVLRGDFRAGALARIWRGDLVDLNTMLADRVGEHTVTRPAETDVERMQYLCTTVIITDVVQDVTTYLDTSAPVNMDAADYTGQSISDYINDCMQASNKNCYLLNVDNAGTYEIAIWYGPPTLTTFSSSTKISNVLADVNSSTVFAPFLDADFARDPSRVYVGLHTNYDGGFVYQTRGATYDEFFARRDTIYDAVNVKTSTIANARTLSQLETMKDEDDTITCTILVDSAHVNDIRAGMRVQAKFSHLVFTHGDSYDEYTWFRVLNRTITLVSPPDDTGSSLYEVQMTLTPKGEEAPVGDVLLAFLAGNSATSPTSEPTDISTHAWTKLYWSGDFCVPPVSGGAGPPQYQAIGVYVRDVVAGETATVLQFTPTGSTPNVSAWVYQLAGIVGGAAGVALSIDALDTVANGAAKTLSASAGSTDSVLFGAINWGKVSYDGGWCVGGVGGASKVVSTTTGTEIVNASSNNSCDQSVPWSWQAYTTGIGTLSLTAQSLAGSYGSGAYTSGWDVGKAAILAPIGSFAITQQGFAASQLTGPDCTVTLGAPPSGGGGGGGGGSSTVSSIAALKTALADDSITDIVVANGTYVVDSAFANTTDSLYIGSAYASRTNPVTVSAATTGGVTFSRSGSAGGAICFVEGAHHQTWTGFNFANMTISSTGVIFWGGLAGEDAPHDITLDHFTVESTCHRVNTGTTDHAMYFSYAVDTWANINVTNYTVDASSSMGLSSGIHMDHGYVPADAPNVAAHGVTIDTFTLIGNGSFADQQLLILWEPPIQDWTIQNGTITNAGNVAVRFESIGATAITMTNITSTGSVTQGFYSSLASPTSDYTDLSAELTVSGCSFA